VTAPSSRTATTSARLPLVALTAGEPAGIGPDLCALLARDTFPGRLVILGDQATIASRARLRGVPFDVPAYTGRATAPAISILSIPAAVAVQAGRLDAANGRHVIALLDRAIDGCMSAEFDAMVTAPVQKSTINDAGIAFTGHTEYLAQRTGTPRVVMLLVGGGLRVALATTHLPLSQVPAAITRESLAAVLRILDGDLRRRFGFARPRILVAGLNPHAGESGYLGREEIEVITPVIEALAREGLAVSGPFPADTLFTPKMLEGADATLAMFHDQGLPVLKHASFGGGVNVTLGLPLVRTSVDHGTALDLAGGGDIDTGSLREAVALAFELAART
jgi:4-hydroxythreonine-4-phosphate dehydrogenase